MLLDFHRSQYNERDTVCVVRGICLYWLHLKIKFTNSDSPWSTKFYITFHLLVGLLFIFPLYTILQSLCPVSRTMAEWRLKKNTQFLEFSQGFPTVAFALAWIHKYLSIRVQYGRIYRNTLAFWIVFGCSVRACEFSLYETVWGK